MFFFSSSLLLCYNKIFIVTENKTTDLYARTICTCVKFIQVVSEVSLRESGYLSDDGQSYIISIQYFFDRMAVCAITSAGDIILWDVTTNEVCILFQLFASRFG